MKEGAPVYRNDDLFPVLEEMGFIYFDMSPRYLLFDLFDNAIDRDDFEWLENRMCGRDHQRLSYYIQLHNAHMGLRKGDSELPDRSNWIVELFDEHYNRMKRDFPHEGLSLISELMVRHARWNSKHKNIWLDIIQNHVYTPNNRAFMHSWICTCCSLLAGRAPAKVISNILDSYRYSKVNTINLPDEVRIKIEILVKLFK